MARMFSQKQILPIAIAAAAGAGVLYLVTRPKGPPPPPTCPPGQMWNPTLNACLPSVGPIGPIGPVIPTGNIGALAQVGDDVLVPIPAIAAAAPGLPGLGLPGNSSVFMTITAVTDDSVTGPVTGFPLSPATGMPAPGAPKFPLPTPTPPVTVPRTAIQQVLRNGVPQVPILTPTGATPMGPAMMPPTTPPATPPAAPTPPGAPTPRGPADGRERGGAAIAGCGGWGPSYPWYAPYAPVPAPVAVFGAAAARPSLTPEQRAAWHRWQARHRRIAVPTPYRSASSRIR